LNGLCVTGIDVSGEAVAAAVRESWADSRRATFRVSDACDLPFGGATFDALVSVSVLQYVAWPAVLRECRRVLAPGGRAIFIENLRGHPLARAYRTVRRTAWPYAPDLVPRRHLGWEDLGVFRDAFGSVEVRPFHLLSPAMLASHALREPRAATFGPIGNGGFRLLSQLDAALLSRWPGLARSAWLACIMCTQRSPRRETGQEAS
jgi:SAM-dependent methyltransferase